MRQASLPISRLRAKSGVIQIKKKEPLLRRIDSIDFFRLIAIVAVIIIHSTAFKSNLPCTNHLFEDFYIFLNQASRFAVPFFFFISGFLWGKKVRESGNPLSTAKASARRIGLIYLAWCIIYLLPLNLSSIHEYGLLGPIKISYWNIMYLLHNPMKLILEGTKVHLWFLPALILCFYISGLFIRFNLFKSLFFFSLSLYLIGLLTKAYANTPLGFSINLNMRDGPFLGLLPFVSGIWSSEFNPDSKWMKYGLILFLMGIISHFFEIYLLWKYFKTTPLQDYVLGTYFMGLGVGLMSLSNHPLFKIPILTAIGRMTLGIYVIHVIFIELLNPINQRTDNLFWEISHIFIVLSLSALSVALLSKNKKIIKIIS